MRGLLIAIAVSAAALGQTVEFEAASIKPSTPPAGGGLVFFGCRGGPGTNDPALYTCQNLGLNNYVMTAYKVNAYQFSGPDWMQRAQFDLQARVPEGATKDDLILMVRAMLAERFKLVVHNETRTQNLYELVVARGGPRFKESTGPPPPPDANAAPVFPGMGADGYPALPPIRPGMAIMNNKARLNVVDSTMEAFAKQMAGQMSAPVNDGTGLKGKYTFSLYWNAGRPRLNARPADGAAAAAPEQDFGPDLMQALQDQLGLRLESKKGPVNFVVVDRAEKTPTEN
jgi:uncharacterized protein (TIGR03435 family)